MTNEEIVHILATEVMGWKQVTEPPDHEYWPRFYEGVWPKGDNGSFRRKVWRRKYKSTFKTYGWNWNPLKDHNHWRMVEEKVMEDEKLWEQFRKQLIFAMDFMGENDNLNAMQLYMKADLPTRAKALIQALDSLSQS